MDLDSSLVAELKKPFSSYILTGNSPIQLESQAKLFASKILFNSDTYIDHPDIRYVDSENKGEIFGLFALSGKVTAFLGPLLLSITVYVFDSQRVGMGSIIIFLILGLLFLLRVKEPRTL